MLEPDEKEEGKAQENEEEEGDNLKQVEEDREEEEKKKEDALWASFLSDVGQKPKVAVATQADKVPGPSPRGCEKGLKLESADSGWQQLQLELWRARICPCPICFASSSVPGSPGGGVPL